MKINDRDTVIFLGDSVTDCGREPGDNGEGPLGSNAYGGGYPRFFSSLYKVMHPERQVRFINKGIGGNQTRHVLARLQKDVLDYHPDVVTLCIGINDVWRLFDRPQIPGDGVDAEEYRANMVSIIESILKETDRLVLLTPYLIDRSPYEPMRLKMIEYGNICKELGEKYSLPVIDLQALFEGLMEKGATSYDLAGDRVHPHSTGHMAITLKLMEVFEETVRL